VERVVSAADVPNSTSEVEGRSVVQSIVALDRVMLLVSMP